MIKVFNELYTLVKNELETNFEGIKASSVYTNTPSSYPFVSIEELDNSIYEQGIDDGKLENFVNVDYELNIYTKGTKRKSESDKILEVIDDILSSLGFVRTNTYPIPTNDETLYRVAVRYSGVVSTKKIIYRR